MIYKYKKVQEKLIAQINKVRGKNKQINFPWNKGRKLCTYTRKMAEKQITGKLSSSVQIGIGKEIEVIEGLRERWAFDLD